MARSEPLRTRSSPGRRHDGGSEWHVEVTVHTGQQYDYEMSGIFFDGLELPHPDEHLAVGSGSHGAQSGEMLKGVEAVRLAKRPDLLPIYGETNSTAAGALVASKLPVRATHIEAGLRSFNRRMPEEINRVVSDHLWDLLLCPSDTAVRNLGTEGITRSVHHVRATSKSSRACCGAWTLMKKLLCRSELKTRTKPYGHLREEAKYESSIA